VPWGGTLGLRRIRASGRKIAAALVAGIVSSALWAPSIGEASPASSAQEDPTAQSGGESSQATVEIDVDVASGDEVAIAGALEDLTANVSAQLAQLEAAQDQVTAADAALEQANAAVEATQTEIDRLTGLSDEVVVSAFMTPPSVAATDAFEAETIDEITVKTSLLDMQADADADVLAQLDAAREQQENQREIQDEAAAAADEAKAQAQAALADVQAATGQQARFLGQVQDRINQGLAEAAALANLDPDLAAELQARATELANQLQEIADTRAYQEALRQLQEEQAQAAAAAPPDPVTLGPPSGSLADVACPGGGSITVDSTLEGPLTSLLADAAAEGVMLCGGGYRSTEAQIELRRQNCGTSDYAIYEMPASDCSPPTAIPGHSEHERGLAIDFTCNGGGVISSTSSPCYQWLDANAAGYGLYQLPSEIWHFSTTGD
jgi:LAS superfamily LD-carboxypeptidase LdcB